MKITTSISCFGLLLLIAGLFSCYYDKYDALYKSNSTGCDTSAALYTQKVVPILQQQCYSCHTPSNAGGGIVMGTYATDKALALNGKLYGTINWGAGFSPMPKGAPKMSACNINLIKKWIDAGAPNN